MNQDSALEFLKRLADGLAVMFGGNCETVIYDMLNADRAILYIRNGHVTNRTEGEPFQLLGMEDVDQLFAGTDIVNCSAVTPDKRSLKSSTFHLRGAGYHYALGINFDHTNLLLAHTAIQELLQAGETDEPVDKQRRPDDFLNDIFDEALQMVGRPVYLLTKEDRLQIVEYLEQHGAFSMQKSIPLVSEKLNVSRYTIYNYLREIKG